MALGVLPNHRTLSGGFKTSDGTLYVSKPYRSKSSKKLRALITFAPRKSHFDSNNESSGSNEFRVHIYHSVPIIPKPTYLTSAFLSGLLLPLLDLNFHFHCTCICTRHRDQWAPAQLSFCVNVFARCHYPGDQRCSSRLKHWSMCSFCYCFEEWMDKVLLDRSGFPAFIADIDPLHSDCMDLQSASLSVSMFKHNTNYLLAGNGHGFNQDFLLYTPSYAPCPKTPTTSTLIPSNRL